MSTCKLNRQQKQGKAKRNKRTNYYDKVALMDLKFKSTSRTVELDNTDSCHIPSVNNLSH